MNNKKTMIGYNRRVDYVWLEYTANLMGQGLPAAEIYAALSSLLGERFSVGSNASRNSREKTITILLKTWVNVSKELVTLRNDAMTLLAGLPAEDRKAVHWGMSMAAYPFWGTVAEITGRLLRLQRTASTVQVQRRIKEKYGQRENAARSARYVLRAFIDWKVLEETTKQGVYRQGIVRRISDSRLISWLVEAFLISSGNDSALLKSIVHGPALFPFIMELPNARALEKSERLEIIQHGLNEQVVALRKRDNSNVAKGVRPSNSPLLTEKRQYNLELH